MLQERPKLRPSHNIWLLLPKTHLLIVNPSTNLQDLGEHGWRLQTMADVSSEPTFKSTRQPLPERPSDPHSIFLLKWGREPKSNSSLIFRVWNESRYTYISPRDAKENKRKAFWGPIPNPCHCRVRSVGLFSPLKCLNLLPTWIHMYSLLSSFQAFT